MIGITVRAATPLDTPLLWRMLTFAASMDGGGGAEVVAHAQADPGLCSYVQGFGRSGDLGVIGALGERVVGAAWLRLLHGAPHPSKVWTAKVPELAIAVEPEARGEGAGGLLLEALVAAAGDRYPAIMLSVREGNAAVRLYERFGFATERRVVNRVGGVSLVMRRPLP